MDKVQQTLFDSWSAHISGHHSRVMDTTCYEREVRYPTNEKLLWESVEWSYRQLKAICKVLGIKTPGTKYLKWQRRNISYSKMRRKIKSKCRRLDRSLLLLLDKIDGELRKLEKDYKLQMPGKYHRRRATIKKIYTQ
ncbi:hypothetical protein MWU78_21710 [Arenibacter sp. F26102]|uniref:hypothetical protein n=1 Tax=Arenibacter sp. F26102 TaxID=2926416 RepID=UPI001FF5E40E|nr:hypothetical protein [Arenibacter sp. F26102]MCK0148276.1 hypothetical protein [Arenibacter sp. F26102]